MLESLLGAPDPFSGSQYNTEKQGTRSAAGTTVQVPLVKKGSGWTVSRGLAPPTPDLDKPHLPHNNALILDRCKRAQE